MEMKTFEYGAMSSRFSCQAENKLTAYAAMVFHYQQSAHLVAIYSPEECREDSWLNPTGKISQRLHEVFGGKAEDFPDNDAFDRYVEKHEEKIIACYETIKRLV